MACASCNKKPSLTRMTVSAAKATGRVIKAKASGKEIHVTDDAFKARMEKCVQCDLCKVIHHESGKVFHRCMDCGCWLDGEYLHKAKLATEVCPKGLW